jgi:hypothetical protein
LGLPPGLGTDARLWRVDGKAPTWKAAKLAAAGFGIVDARGCNSHSDFTISGKTCTFMKAIDLGMK